MIWFLELQGTPSILPQLVSSVSWQQSVIMSPLTGQCIFKLDIELVKWHYKETKIYVTKRTIIVAKPLGITVSRSPYLHGTGGSC